MAFTPGFRGRLLVGDFNLAAYTKSWSAPWTCAMLDTSVLTDDGAKTFIPGQDTGTLSVSGLYDAAVTTDISAWKTSGVAQAVSVAPSGFARGSELILANALDTEFTPSAAVDGLVQFTLNCQTDGMSDLNGVSLHDLTAVTADESGTGVDGGAASSNGAVAHLHVTAFSGFSGAVVTVEDSSNNSTWATIGTFSTVSGVTGERITIAGTVRRYTRYSVDVTGTGSITFAVALARH